MKTQDFERMLTDWIRVSIGRGTSERSVAELAKAIALMKIADAINDFNRKY